MLKKKKKKSDAGYGGEDMKKEKSDKKSYAQLLTDIAAKKYSDGV